MSGCCLLSALCWGFCLRCFSPVQGAEGLKPLPLISCSPSSSLRQVLALLATHGLHRLHVLDVRQRPVGILTITDLLRVIVGGTELLEAVQPVSLNGLGGLKSHELPLVIQ